MGAPHLSYKMERLIPETFIALRGALNYEPSGKQVHNTLIYRLNAEHYTGSDIPSLRTVQQRMTKAREREKEFQGSSRIDESKPWSMLTLKDLSLPPESIPFVLQQWRYSISLDVVFTIRQAKWASRLYTLFREKDIAEQWFESRRYAREEELSILSDTPMNIYQLDSHLVMGVWERFTAEWTDILEDPIGYVCHTIVPLAQDGGIAEELINAIPSFDWDYNDPDPERFDRILLTSSLVGGLPSSTNYFPDLETRMVYLRHLSYIAKMPEWNTLKPEEIRDIILTLRKLVINLKQDIEKEKSRPVEGIAKILGDWGIFERLHWEVHEILDDIYERAGQSM